MPPVLRLYEDTFDNDGAELALPARPHMIYVVHGAIAVAERIVRSDEAFGGEAATRIKGGPEGATIWRWEFARGFAGRRTGRHVCRFARKIFRAARYAPAGPTTSPRRQRRLSAGRLRLSAPAPRTGHPLPARGRHSHRHARPLDVLRAGEPVVRERA